MTAADKVRVAIDAMGGDHGPQVTLAAAHKALHDDPGLELIVVGSPVIASLILKWPRDIAERVEHVVCEAVLPMDVSASHALRHGRETSLGRTVTLVGERRADAAVSAGNTGAIMALARMQLGMITGIDRPALMAALPSGRQSVWVLDLGANVGVDARRLFEFAQLGATAAEILGGRAPRIGLLNIGHEDSKGPDAVREAARLIDQRADLDYAGFVEADQVFSGQVDVVVCDGFAGNVLLKSAEGAMRILFEQLRQQLSSTLAGWMCRRRLKPLRDTFDPARHNGAPLLGLAGVVIKSHGGAGPDAFAHAIAMAALEARRGLVGELERRLWAGD